MNATQIRRLVEGLPAHSPYLLGSDRAGTRLSVIVRQAIEDPALGWHVAQAYANAGEYLHERRFPGTWVHANRLLVRQARNASFELARMLNSPAAQAQREPVRALLVCDDGDVETVARLCKLDIAVVRLYEALFWNTSDRKEETYYLARLCQRVGEQRNGAGSELLKVAYEDGRTAAVLNAAGLAPRPDAERSMPELLRELLSRLEDEARRDMRGGKGASAAVQLLWQIRSKAPEPEAGENKLQGPSLAEAAMLTLEKMLGSTIPSLTQDRANAQQIQTRPETAEAAPISAPSPAAG